MCCSKRTSKIILVVLNILFILFGLGILIPGILVVANESAINDEVFPALQSVSFGVSNLGDMAKGLSITLIVIGSFVVVLSLLGCMGACCEVKCLLVVYIIIVGLLMLAKLIIVVLWMVFNSSVQSELKSELKKGLYKFSTDDLTTDETSTGWNYLNMNFQCCGIEDAVTEYATATWSDAPNEVPKSCCKGVTSSNYAAATTACQQSGSTTNRYTDNCYDAIKNFAEKYSIAFICIGIFILLVEIASIILACILCKDSGRDMLV